MRYCLWLLLVATVLFVTTSCSHNPKAEEEPPLLLKEPGEAEKAANMPEGSVADNSRCHVCHMNYEEEELAVLHAKANVGCEDCHGDSTPHCSDEDNITPPDIMYANEKNNPFCLKCHAGNKLSKMHKPFLAGAATEKKYCTDCHGEHRLAYRTRRWDKTTRNLIQDDGVRMLTGEFLEQK